MKRLLWINGLAALALWMATTIAGAAEPVRVFAAASLQGPLDRVADTWPGGATISYAGSGTIARQIDLGAPADVIMLASPDWMRWLRDRGALAGDPVDIISNRLVIIGPSDAAPLPDLTAPALRTRLGDSRLAMGQHRAVPAGLYAAAWMRNAGLWDALAPHLAETENVRAALALVARGEAPLGIVYASDAAASAAVRVLYTVPADAHPPIRYPAAAITPQGAAFVAHLAKHADQFVAAGFTDLPR
ncbi:molybdate ABC transporter substrate-binding protein [Tateyamaria sp. SN6-1]|uniref:molybdate ABC transporter substrate-binding protein n=1 Tax=Tateyamaria sp. SN6-1 TaxID=3092148 RepID=UPI0039F57D66